MRLVPGMLITVSPHWIPMYASPLGRDSEGMPESREIEQFVRGLIIAVKESPYDLTGRTWMLVLDAALVRTGWILVEGTGKLGLIRVEASP